MVGVEKPTDNIFGLEPGSGVSCMIYVPANSIETYMFDRVWYVYTDITFPLD